MDSSGGDGGGQGQGESGSGVGTLGAIGVGIGAGAGIFGGQAGFTGTGIREVLQSIVKQQILAARRQAVMDRIALAGVAASGKFVESEHPYLSETMKVTPQTKALAEQIVALKGAGKGHQAQQKQKSLTKLQTRLAPEAEYRYVASYGVAGGGPIRGSRDDPNGAYRDPRLTTSLLGR